MTIAIRYSVQRKLRLLQSVSPYYLSVESNPLVLVSRLEELDRHRAAQVVRQPLGHVLHARLLPVEVAGV